VITGTGVKRFAHILVISSVLGAVLGPARPALAETDVVVVDAVFGGTISKFDGARKWQPTLWLDGAFRLAGPLQLGGYFQWLGKNSPIDDAGLGGGGLLALRWKVKNLRISGAFTGGYLRVPLPDTTRGAGTIGAFPGLGYAFLSWMGVEVRGRWMRYFNMPSGAPNHSWSIEAGLSFFID